MPIIFKYLKLFGGDTQRFEEIVIGCPYVGVYGGAVRGVGGHEGVYGPGGVDGRHHGAPDQRVQGAGDGRGPGHQQDAVAYQAGPQHQYTDYIAPQGNQGTQK